MTASLSPSLQAVSRPVGLLSQSSCIRLKEAEERVVKLPENDPSTFPLYLHFVYKRDFPVVANKELEDDCGQEEKHSIAKLYLLAEQLQNTGAKNAALIAFVASIFASRKDKKWHAPVVKT